MKIVIARPYEDKDILDPYVVEYHGEKKNPDFELDWDSCLNKIKKGHPETWDVSEVISLMEAKGWGMLSVDYMTVTY